MFFVTKEVEKRFSRVYRGLSHVAVVTLQLAEASEASGVTIRCTALPTVASQGYIEDVPANGYDDWKQGAALGAKYALAVAGEKARSVIVSRIQGLTTDTNPTVVRAAAALGVWEAVGYQPTPEQIQQIERHVFGSWQRPFDALPDFRSAPDTPTA